MLRPFSGFAFNAGLPSCIPAGSPVAVFDFAGSQSLEPAILPGAWTPSYSRNSVAHYLHPDGDKLQQYQINEPIVDSRGLFIGSNSKNWLLQTNRLDLSPWSGAAAFTPNTFNPNIVNDQIGILGGTLTDSSAVAAQSKLQSFSWQSTLRYGSIQDAGWGVGHGILWIRRNTNIANTVLSAIVCTMTDAVNGNTYKSTTVFNSNGLTLGIRYESTGTSVVDTQVLPSNNDLNTGGTIGNSQFWFRVANVGPLCGIRYGDPNSPRNLSIGDTYTVTTEIFPAWRTDTSSIFTQQINAQGSLDIFSILNGATNHSYELVHNAASANTRISDKFLINTGLGAATQAHSAFVRFTQNDPYSVAMVANPAAGSPTSLSGGNFSFPILSIQGSDFQEPSDGTPPRVPYLNPYPGLNEAGVYPKENQVRFLTESVLPNGVVPKGSAVFSDPQTLVFSRASLAQDKAKLNGGTLELTHTARTGANHPQMGFINLGGLYSKQPGNYITQVRWDDRQANIFFKELALWTRALSDAEINAAMASCVL